MSNKAIGTIGNIDTLTVGGRTYTDLVNLISVCGQVATDSPAAMTPRKSTSGSSGYAVTSGKTFKVSSLKLSKANTSSNDNFSFGYCDNDCGINSGTPSNPIYFGTNSSTSALVYRNLTSTNDRIIEISIGNFNVPAGKYLFCKTESSSASFFVQFFGYEE